jgi:hypothetical protein
MVDVVYYTTISLAGMAGGMLLVHGPIYASLQILRSVTSGSEWHAVEST